MTKVTIHEENKCKKCMYYKNNKCKCPLGQCYKNITSQIKK